MLKRLALVSTILAIPTQPMAFGFGDVVGFAVDPVGSTLGIPGSAGSIISGGAGAAKDTAKIPQEMLKALLDIADQMRVFTALLDEPEGLTALTTYAAKMFIRAQFYKTLGEEVGIDLAPLRPFLGTHGRNIIRGLYGTQTAREYSRLVRSLRFANTSYARGLAALDDDLVSAQAFRSAAHIANKLSIEAPWWTATVLAESNLIIAAHEENQRSVENMKRQIDAHEEAMRLAAIEDALERRAAFEKAILEQGEKCARGHCKYVKRVD